MRSDRVVINAAALAQGAAFVIYGSYAAVLISRHYYHLSVSEYSLLFLPQFVAAVTSAVLAARMARRLSTKRVYMAGLGSSLAAMVLLLVSVIAGDAGAFGYPLLLASAAFLGGGFGLGFPSLLMYARILNPAQPDRAVIVLNGLLGAGMAAAPALAIELDRTPFWWSLPVLLAVLFILLMTASPRLPRTRAADTVMLPFDLRLPPRLRAYGLLTLVYSACAIMCLLWAQVGAARTAQRPAPPGPVLLAWFRASAAAPGQSLMTPKSLMLAAFWAALVMAIRVLFAWVDRRGAPRPLSLIPFGLAAAVAVIGLLADATMMGRVGLYALAAVGCAAFLPLRTRAGDEYLDILAVAITGGIAILYQIELGFANEILATMRREGLTLLAIFGIAGALGLLASLPASRILAEPLRSGRQRGQPGGGTRANHQDSGPGQDRP